MGEKQAVTKLSAWFERIARPLPWRATRDPYAIWISEVMLQQTQVAAVIPYYERFLARFPTVRDLALAPEQDVLHLWSGLGYYSRARNLQKGARYLLEKYQGVFPRTREEALEVPGVGPYTAGAVLSIAYDLAVPIVDGNVQRVFSRYYAVKDSLETKAASRFFWSQAEAWVQRSAHPRILNQALMELGATVCTKANPLCAQCPLREGCAARAVGTPEKFPVRAERRRTVELWWVAVLRQRGEKIWLVQNKDGAWWSGLWDFPRVETASELAQKQTAGTLSPQRLAPYKHTVTHHRIHVLPIVLPWKKGSPPESTGRWVTPEEAKALPLSSLAKKLLQGYETHGA